MRIRVVTFRSLQLRAVPPTGQEMDGVSSAALGVLRHPDQSVARVAPAGLTIVWAEPERIAEVAEAVERALGWNLPALCASPADPSFAMSSFPLVRVGDGGAGVPDDDGAIDELLGRLEAMREAVPAAIRDLSARVSETAEALVAAEDRREQLKAALRDQAATLAGTVEARSVVGVQRRVAALEIERRGLGTAELGELRRAYEALVGLDESALPVDPDAARLAAQWDRLLADEALLDRAEARHPLTDQLLGLQAKQRQAEQAVVVARADVARPRPTAADRAEIERLHALAETAVEVGARRGGRRTEPASGADDPLEAELGLLARFGFDSYADYIISGAIDPPIAAATRLRGAEQKLAAVEAMIAELRAHMAPSPERQSLLDRADRLAAEIATRFGAIDPSEDVAAVLRDIRRPPVEWDELADALWAVGREPTDDPLTVAYGVLAEGEGHRLRLEAVEEELAELRARLDELGPEALARYGPVGAAAAELVYLDHAHGRITADLARLRAELAAELEHDPDLRPTLELIGGLDRELAELAQRLGAEVLDDDRRSPREVVVSALEPVLASTAGGSPTGGPGPATVVAVFEPWFDQALASAPGDELVACLDLLLDLAVDRQLVVLTACQPLAAAAYADGEPTLTSFVPA